MNAKILPVPWIFAAALLAVATAGMAETPPRHVAPVKITPELILQASELPQPSQDSPYLLRRDVQAHDLFRDTPKNLEHVPNGCSHNNASLCFDYRTGHAVYKPMRKLLPEIPGMTAHNLSLRRGKIVAQYTF